MTMNSEPDSPRPTIDAYLRAVSMCSSSGWGGRPVLCTVRVPVLVSDAVRSDGGDGDGS